MMDRPLDQGERAGGQPGHPVASILMVDDSPANLLALTVALEPLGQRLVTAASGEEALACAAREDFAVVLLDVHMPILDGFETAARLKALERSRHTPIIFLTARDDSVAVVAQAYREGGVDFLSKPLDLDIVRSKVRVFVELFVVAQRAERAERIAAERMKELVRSNNELEQFVYVASHDLQEPLRMVGSYTQLLARRYKGQLDADADEFIAFAVDGVVRMQNLINDLLAYARVGSPGDEMQVLDSGVVLDKAISNLEGAIRDARATISRTAMPVVRADAAQLTQLFQNLISNALKFRRDEPPNVAVSAEREGASWHFAVRDEGIGIDPAYFDRIFVIFQRLHARDRYPGTGIGLAICKKIVERHRGAIWVESAVGAGSTFHFTLPAGEAR
jgi:signal transduction histidine kinase